MEKQKNNKVVITLLVAIIVILSVLCILFATGTISLNTNKENDNNTNENITDNGQNNQEENNNDTNSEDSNLNDIRKSIENIVEEELYVLWNKKGIGEISTQERLQLALERYARDNNLNILNYQPETVSASELENSYYKTSCTINPLIHQNIYLYEKVSSSSDVLYTYDANTKTYKVNPVGKGTIKIKPTYSNVVEFKELSENEYSISYQYLFTWVNHGDVDNNVYFSYNDAKNQVNGIKVFDIKGMLNSYDELETELNDYIKDNYDKIKDKLITHNYEFSYELGKYNLKNFYLS